MKPLSTKDTDVANLHIVHPRIRAKDWRSPLVLRLLKGASYADASCSVVDSYRSQADGPITGELVLYWSGLREDFEQCRNTYQEPVLTEYAALGLACILVHCRPGLEITEVTRRGDKVDYWLGDRELLLEVSGAQQCDLDALCRKKAEEQLLQNPFERDGYVCVTDFSTQQVRLWFYSFRGGK